MNSLENSKNDCQENVSKIQIPLKCALLKSTTEKSCQENWKWSDKFLSEDQVELRLSNCDTYFDKVPTTANKPVIIKVPIFYCLMKKFKSLNFYQFFFS